VSRGSDGTWAGRLSRKGERKNYSGKEGIRGGIAIEQTKERARTRAEEGVTVDQEGESYEHRESGVEEGQEERQTEEGAGRKEREKGMN